MGTLQFPKNPSINDEYDWEGLSMFMMVRNVIPLVWGHNPVNDLKDALEPRI